MESSQAWHSSSFHYNAVNTSHMGMRGIQRNLATVILCSTFLWIFFFFNHVRYILQCEFSHSQIILLLCSHSAVDGQS